MYKIPELLAPAGGFEQLKAAVENGADAVYMGGKFFNARINANNFDSLEMRQAVEYAHIRGVKLYVTMNTLVNDEELIPALSYAAELYDYGVDALILQDLGLAALIRENIPKMNIHFSTQGTIYNAEGVKAAKKQGFSRVVLARELSLAEIKTITKEETMEIEVFVHGALCICYSGQCQMSNEIGGRSGNRGTCAQPCRLPYQIFKDEGKVQRSLGQTSFALSPKDMCLVQHLGALAEAGVDSLKIEGRMKSPEYVAIVTRIYRKYLDLYARTGAYTVTKEDLHDLNQIFNRGGFTDGYLFENPQKSLMSGDLPKHQGIFIGKVKSSNAKNCLVEIELEEPLSMGDGIEIRSKGLPGNVVTYLKKQTAGNHAKAGEVVMVGDIIGVVNPGDHVYKITDKALMQRARNSFEGKSWEAEKQLKKVGIDILFTATLDKPACLHIWDELGNHITKALDDPTEKARNRGLDQETVSIQLNKTGGTPFAVVKCEINIEEGLSVPLSKINQLRRDALEELVERRKNRDSAAEDYGRSLYIEERKTQIFKDWKIAYPSLKERDEKKEETEKAKRSLYLFSTGELKNADLAWLRGGERKTASHTGGRIYLPFECFLERPFSDDMDGYLHEGFHLVPVIPNITKGWHDEMIRKNFDQIADIAKKYGISIGNISWIEAFVETGANVYGDYGLNLCNSADFLVAKQLGLKEAVISHEASQEEIKQMNFHGVKAELAVDGKLPVMTSEHCALGDLGVCPDSRQKNTEKNSNDCERDACQKGNYFLKDRKGEIFRIISNNKNCKIVIISQKINKLAGKQELFNLKSLNCLRSYGK